MCKKRPYSKFFQSVFSPNAGKYGPEKFRIRTLFTQCNTREIYSNLILVAKNNVLSFFKYQNNMNYILISLLLTLKKMSHRILVYLLGSRYILVKTQEK